MLIAGTRGPLSRLVEKNFLYIWGIYSGFEPLGWTSAKDRHLMGAALNHDFQSANISLVQRYYITIYSVAKSDQTGYNYESVRFTI